MAAHAFLLCSLALLSALSRPGLSFSEEEDQPGLIYDEVPEILDRRYIHPLYMCCDQRRGVGEGGGGVQGDACRDAGMLMCSLGVPFVPSLCQRFPFSHLECGSDC